jgi:probable HAF family extracellular repeat protein
VFQLYDKRRLHSKTVIEELSDCHVGNVRDGRFCGLETALANPTHSFTTIDAPAANGITAASGINDSGQIVGYFQDVALAIHGFLDTGGSFSIQHDIAGGKTLE